MPGNRIKTMKALQSRKSNVNGHKLHPNSRRAKQLQRVELRTKKLDLQGKVQRVNEIKRVDRHLHFVHSMPPDEDAISLPALHQILVDYIHRDDTEIAELVAERKERSWRKAEGKTKRELELDMQKEADLGEYRSGFVLPDLTIPENVFLCRQWINPIGSDKNPRIKGGDPSFLGRLRMIRINSENKDAVVVVTEGAREGEWEQPGENGSGDEEMGDAEA